LKLITTDYKTFYKFYKLT